MAVRLVGGYEAGQQKSSKKRITVVRIYSCGSRPLTRLTSALICGQRGSPRGANGKIIASFTGTRHPLIYAFLLANRQGSYFKSKAGRSSPYPGGAFSFLSSFVNVIAHPGVFFF